MGAYDRASLYSLPAGLAMFSVPSDYSGQSLAATLGYASPILAIWDPTTYQYDVTPAADASSLAVGRAYWVRSPSLSIYNSGVTTPTLSPFSMPLQAGWNMIGDPFPTDEPLTNCTVTSQMGASLSFAAATTAGIVGAPVWSYSNGGYVQTTTLTPYQGYWILANYACTLNIPPP
jgi:hypothetical protein